MHHVQKSRGRLRPTLLAIPALTLTISVTVFAREKTASLDQVLQLAGRYVVEYGASTSVLVSTERYEQRVELGGLSRGSVRVLVSEYALVRTANKWNGVRDVYDVDGHLIREQKDRLEKVLLVGGSAAFSRAQELGNESLQYNAAPIQRNLNTPTMALYFLQPDLQRRFRFKKTGEDRIDGVQVWRIRYQESARPALVVTSGGKDLPVSGTYWISPADGTVMKSEMAIESQAHVDDAATGSNRGGGRRGGGQSNRSGRVQSSARVTVTYRHDTGLGLFVPAEMRESYELPSARSGAGGTTTITCRATYDGVRRLEAPPDTPKQPTVY
jgi:hypothetical protein